MYVDVFRHINKAHGVGIQSISIFMPSSTIPLRKKKCKFNLFCAFHASSIFEMKKVNTLKAFSKWHMVLPLLFPWASVAMKGSATSWAE